MYVFAGDLWTWFYSIGILLEFDLIFPQKDVYSVICVDGCFSLCSELQHHLLPVHRYVPPLTPGSALTLNVFVALYYNSFSCPLSTADCGFPHRQQLSLIEAFCMLYLKLHF